MASPPQPPPESGDQVLLLLHLLLMMMMISRTIIGRKDGMYHDGNADASMPSGVSSWVDGFLNCVDKKLFCHARCLALFERDLPLSLLQGKEHAEAPPPLMLRLNKDVIFMDRVWTSLFLKPQRLRLAILRNDLPRNRRDMEQLKVARVPATLIRIGSWQFASEHEGDLVAKFFFATEILAWEVLMNGIQYKMEIRWSDISSIRATIEENKPGILEIELHWSPTFYRETNQQPRDHSNWISADDFTGGQAPTCGRHYLEFPPAALGRAYVRLLSSDRRLLELSLGRFPSNPWN
ncbi:hypothetical protein EUGRSUZ_H03288 [Eucalyptus grandis]|uniref:TRF2/HOY1 PH-like domain-containing protein n=2 Tax=Eucalyptus grandis TaxID=71139 RepID=A0A059B3G7_EUCGR|nr:hypothetical protein EUGRSUZ_H03288 [Eucalyptus grandis]